MTVALFLRMVSFVPDNLTGPAHISYSEWINTKIILSGADAAYGSTLNKSKDINGDLTTKDGGTTWTSTVFNIPEYTFK